MRLASDSPFYRVTVKALIYSGPDRILVVRNEEDTWEMPGGGWEHGETLMECIKRELQEELGVSVRNPDDQIVFTYVAQSKRDFKVLRLVVNISLDNEKFSPSDGIVEARYVTREELLALPMDIDEAGIKQQAGKIWPKVA